jgi:signal transduction histidine kinase
MERLVDRAYATFSEEARRRVIEYRRELEAKPVIVSDGDRVLQIITNLLSNAFRWTPDGGSVGLELTATDGSVYVGVADSGPGIAPSERERIFRPFWSRGGGGTASACRLRASSPRRSAGGSASSSARPGAASS